MITRGELRERAANVPTEKRDGRRDFDFQAGTWEVRHWRLRHPLSGSSESYEFDGTCVQHPIWDGAGNFEEHDLASPLGAFHGAALRLYDPETALWSIYWASSTGGLSAVPTVGSFDENGLGEFFDRETFDGKPIVSRYRWRSGGVARCRWEQAFSPDEGAKWETNWTMDFTRVPPVVELRQYTLRPGARDTLIELFDRELVEPQEEAGAMVLGQFRSVENADRFVWLRGFAGMLSRERALRDFYTGPVWRQHRDAANVTMIDSDNVLLLKPARPFSGISLRGRQRDASVPTSLIVSTVCSFGSPVGPDVVEDFESRIAPEITRAGGAVLGYYVTEPAANTFPALPVRENENVFVWFSSFPDRDAYVSVEGLVPKREQTRPPETQTLVPTERSLMRS